MSKDQVELCIAFITRKAANFVDNFVGIHVNISNH